MGSKPWSIGSRWLRWDPHIHTPATALANEFNGDWDGYFAAIEAASPPASALGITDYASILGYKEFRERRGSRLPSVEFIFPNIEFRVSVQTAAGKGINVHLLVSPDDQQHIARIDDALSRLFFEFKGQPYSCTARGLADLGRAYNKGQTDERAAYCDGVNLFKPSFESLRDWLLKEGWLRANSLVAVSPKSKDGTAGLSGDDGFAAYRAEIQRFAHIILSGNPKDRAYWLGQGTDPEQRLREEYGNLKPCVPRLVRCSRASFRHSAENRPTPSRACQRPAETEAGSGTPANHRDARG
jgi:hypothetical protein